MESRVEEGGEKVTEVLRRKLSEGRCMCVHIECMINDDIWLN